MEREALEAEIRRFLGEVLGVPIEGSSSAGRLVTTGLVDSADLVRLVTHLERLLRIEIPDREIDVDHFDSIERILDYVSTRRGS